MTKSNVFVSEIIFRAGQLTEPCPENRDVAVSEDAEVDRDAVPERLSLR
jgi:hypothetical protein